MPCRWYQTPMTKGFLGFTCDISITARAGMGESDLHLHCVQLLAHMMKEIENANWNTWASGGAHCRISSYFTCSLTISLSMWPSNCRIVKTRAAVSCAWFEAKNGLNVRRRRSQLSDNIRRICIRGISVQDFHRGLMTSFVRTCLLICFLFACQRAVQ